MRSVTLLSPCKTLFTTGETTSPVTDPIALTAGEKNYCLADAACPANAVPIPISPSCNSRETSAPSICPF